MEIVEGMDIAELLKWYFTRSLPEREFMDVHYERVGSPELFYTEKLILLPGTNALLYNRGNMFKILLCGYEETLVHKENYVWIPPGEIQKSHELSVVRLILRDERIAVS